MTQEIKIDDEFKALIRPLSDSEFRLLELDILKVGCRDPLVLWGKTLVDGHHRHRICTKYNIPFNTVQQEFASRDDAKEWIIKNQFGRRNITKWDRCLLALELEDVFRKRGKENLKRHTGNFDLLGELSKEGMQISANHFLEVDTREDVAKIAGVSHDTLYRVKEILEKATSEQRAALDRDDVSISEIYNEIKNGKPVWIAIEDLGVDVCNVRRGAWDHDMEFVADIRNNGIIHPLLVRPADPSTGKKYAIVAGSRRYHAAFEAGLSKVPCFIEEMDDVEAIGRSIAENRYSKNASDWHYVVSIGEMYELLKKTGDRNQVIETIMDLTGFLRPNVEDYLDASFLPGDSIELIKKPSGRSDEVQGQLQRGEMPAYYSTKSLDVKVAAEISRKSKGLTKERIFELAAEAIVVDKSVISDLIDAAITYPKKSMKDIKETVIGIPKGGGWVFDFDSDVISAMNIACDLRKMDREVLVNYYVKKGLSDDGFLKEVDYGKEES